MTNSPRLELRQSQSQSLVMTQQLQQSIKLLQMTALEVQTFVEAQLEENPFLMEEEREEDLGPPPGEEERRVEEEESEPASEGSAEDAFVQDDWRDGSEMRTPVTPRDSDGDPLEFGDNRAKHITLREHLTQQLEMQVTDPVLRRLGEHLIDLTDDAGYIREDWNSITEQLGTDNEHMEKALAALQSFDPPGVCARSLPECLALQLKDRDRLDPAMEAMLEHLHLLAAGNLEGLKKACGVDTEDLKGMVAELKGLNPKPGLSFQSEMVQPVEPDVTVRRLAGGKWHVELNSSALPKVLVNRRYYAQVNVGAKGTDKKFMTEKMNDASWLVKALDQRANTILKVASSIVAEQEGFFRMGIHHLKPLTLKDIAKETSFHESTVSRVTAGKYLISPRGTFEFKYFFTSGLSHKAGGEDVSSQTVKHLIKEMIEKEGATVLSDDDIADKLKAQNINVARRTVAKYREALGIASSMQRRRSRALE